MKFKYSFFLLLSLTSSAVSFSQKLTIKDIQQKKSYDYTKEKISEFRSSGNVKTGAVEIENQTEGILEILFYHSDAPQNGFQFRLELEPNETRFLFDEYSKKIILANDWGIKFLQKEWESSTFLLGDLCENKNGVYKLSLSGKYFESNQISDSKKEEHDDAEDAMFFSKVSTAVTYLKNNFSASTEKKNGKKWVDILGIEIDDTYLLLVGKLTGTVDEAEIYNAVEEEDLSVIQKKTTVSNDFTARGIAWTKIQQIKIESDANRDNWLVIDGPVETIEEKRVVAKRLRLYVKAAEKANIKNAISFLSKNMEDAIRQQMEVDAEIERQKQSKLQVQKDFDNYRFTSITEASRYLEKVLNCSTSHDRSIKEKCNIPYPNQYIIIEASKENYQAKYFVFSTITEIEQVTEGPSCISCGDEKLIKVTAPVYWFDKHENCSNTYYFSVNDIGIEKAIKAFNYLRANASFGEPQRKGNSQAIQEPTKSSMYEVSINNDTNYDIYVAYASDENGDGNIGTHYWYKFSPGETSLLFRAKNRAFCIYAYSKLPGGKIRQWGNGEEGNMLIEGEQKKASCKVITTGHYRYTLQIH